MLRAFNAFTPVLGFSLAPSTWPSSSQEFFLLFRARTGRGAIKETPAALWYAGLVPGFLYTLFTLSPPSRRRYGGYIVHLGIVHAFIGFTGGRGRSTSETSLAPGQTFHVGDYNLTYTGPRMEVDVNKRMVFADLRARRTARTIGLLHPAKFIYKKIPESPVTDRVDAPVGCARISTSSSAR